MITRYKMYRGKRPVDDPLPAGIRQDTRKHTRHCLRPTDELVHLYLDAPSAKAWKLFEKAYFEVLDDRFMQDASPFHDIAELATKKDVYIGCSCPTSRNPDPARCHTVLALKWMRRRFPHLTVIMPD